MAISEERIAELDKLAIGGVPASPSITPERVTELDAIATQAAPPTPPPVSSAELFKTAPGEDFLKSYKEKLNRLDWEAEDKKIALAVKRAGTFTVASPIFQMMDSFRASREGGKDLFKSTQDALVAGGTDLAAMLTFKTAGKVIKPLARKLATLQGFGRNERLLTHIEENPEILFRPKAKWEKTYRQAFGFFKQQKRKVGQKIGELKKIAAKEGEDLVSESTPIANQIDILLNPQNPEGIAQTNVAAIKAAQKIKTLLIGKEGGTPIKNIDQWRTALRDIDGLPVMGRIFKKQTTEGLQALTNDERLLLKLRTNVLDEMNNIIQSIPGTGKELLKFKKEYADLMNLNKQFKNITVEKMPKILQNSMEINNEPQFRALKEFLPDELFNKSIANALNLPIGGKFERELGKTAVAYGRLRQLGEFLGKKIPQAGSLIGGAKPGFQARPITSAVLQAKDPLAAIISGVPRVGIQEQFVQPGLQQ